MAAFRLLVVLLVVLICTPMLGVQIIKKLFEAVSEVRDDLKEQKPVDKGKVRRLALYGLLALLFIRFVL